MLEITSVATTEADANKSRDEVSTDVNSIAYLAVFSVVLLKICQERHQQQHRQESLQIWPVRVSKIWTLSWTDSLHCFSGKWEEIEYPLKWQSIVWLKRGQLLQLLGVEWCLKWVYWLTRPFVSDQRILSLVEGWLGIHPFSVESWLFVVLLQNKPFFFELVWKCKTTNWMECWVPEESEQGCYCKDYRKCYHDAI